jgi:hypothetical protein
VWGGLHGHHKVQVHPRDLTARPKGEGRKGWCTCNRKKETNIFSSCFILWCAADKEFLWQEKSGRLCYIYGICTSMDLISLPTAPLVLKIGIHQGQAERKGVRGGGGVESLSRKRIHLLASAGSMQSLVPML